MMNFKHILKNNTPVLIENEELETEYHHLAELSIAELFQLFQTSKNGLSDREILQLRNQYGKNNFDTQKRKSWLFFIFRAMMDEFIIVLFALGIISLILNDTVGSIIIFLLALFSAVIRFVQDFLAYRSSLRLKTMLHTTVNVVRNHEKLQININELVPGDIVELGPGSLIPADLILIEGRDLFLSQAMFTGESLPIEKTIGCKTTDQESVRLENLCLMGCNVISGSGLGMVIKTGQSTYLGHIAHTIASIRGKTNFELGISAITNTLVRYMGLVVLAVFVINGLIKHDWLQAFLFSVSIAVGITPGMLPMIVNVTLSKGAQFLAKKKTIVKNSSSVENLGAMDILCTDKTGTLTEDNIVLQRYINVNGEDDITILDYGYLNSYFSTGIKNLIDRAILSYATEHRIIDRMDHYQKIDEIPFDYNRRRMSVVIQDKEGRHKLLTKGAIEDVLKICNSVLDHQMILPISEVLNQKITEHADDLNRDGMHVIALAEKNEQVDVNTFDAKDECDMTFVGYIAFLDPPKLDAREAIDSLYRIGVDVKVLTGDAPLVVSYICKQIGLQSVTMVVGADIEHLSDTELTKKVEEITIFARLTPIQKERVVLALRKNGHVVGYLGDGVNDAPSLRHADVGISVDSAVDIAKESSDILLLEKNLQVVVDGVLEGRRIYGNIMKYMKMTLSSNFGNVFSVLIASLFLPFLPMIPIQILIQNLIYDLTQIAIPWDNVDKDFLEKPHKWDTHSLSRFMNVMGVTSSLYDLISFAMLWFILGYNTIDKQAYFQTGWFIEGLISQTLIVHFIRTSKMPFFQSTANVRLILSTLIGILIALLIPYLFHEVTNFNFTIMTREYYLFLIFILLGYVISIEIIKHIYIRRNGQWL